MAEVYAEWNVGSHTVRKDTRVYLINGGVHKQNQGRCRGIVWMTNPGTKNQPMTGRTIVGNLPWDKWPGSLDPTMQVVVKIIDCATQIAISQKKVVKPDDYIQILNLFYLCWSCKECAWRQSPAVGHREFPCASSNFCWFAWGSPPKTHWLPAGATFLPHPIQLHSLKNPFFFDAKAAGAGIHPVNRNVPRATDEPVHPLRAVFLRIYRLYRQTVRNEIVQHL
jgi:hypothetical protein